MRIGEVIQLAQVPTVVSLAQLEALRRELDRSPQAPLAGAAAALHDLLAQYVVAPEGNKATLDAVLSSLAGQEARGTGFLIQGPHGAGKTHFLSVIALLAEYDAAWDYFLPAHPEYQHVRGLLRAVPPLVVVPVPLDEHRGSREHLEDIVFDLTEEELRRPKYGLNVPLSEESYALELIDRHVAPRYAEPLAALLEQDFGAGTTWETLRDSSPEQAVRAGRKLVRELGYPLDFRQSRIERLARLLEVIRQHNFGGVVWLLDDLAMFLAAMEAKAARNDCAFLHFLGQRSKIAPLWVVGTLQQELESIGEIESVALNEIRDRYNTRLSLSIHQMRRVLRERIVRPVSQEALQQAVAETLEVYGAAFPETELRPESLAESYPLHPLSLACLEASASRVFSQTRSLVDFVLTRVGGRPEDGLPGLLDQDARQLVGLDVLFQHFAVEMARRSETAAYVTQVHDYYTKHVERLLAEEAAFGLRLVEALIVLRLAGIDVPVRLLAEATYRQGEADDQDPVARARRVLETFRLQGSYLDVLHRADRPEDDVYVVDVASHVAEQVRRRIHAQKSVMSDDDPLIVDEAIAACTEPSFPLARFRAEALAEVDWCNSPRVIGVRLADLTGLDAAELTGAVAAISDVEALQTARLYIGRLGRQAPQARRWRELCAGLPPTRWSAGLAAWVPRQLAPAELDALKDYASYRLLLEEPALREDPRSRPLLTRLQEEQAARERAARAVVEAAYYEGEVLGASGPLLSTDDLTALRGDWEAALRRLAETMLQEVYPLFQAIAPRRPLTDEDGVDLLVREFVRPAEVQVEVTSPLAQLIEAVMVPLGLATGRGGSYLLHATEGGVVGAVLDRIRQRDPGPLTQRGRPISCADLAQYFAKSEYGLLPDQFELIVAALLRLGHLMPLDARQQPLVLPEIPTPLAAHVQYVARAPLLSYEQWQLLSRASRWFLDMPVLHPDAPTQESIWTALREQKRTQLQRVAELRHRLEELWEALDQTADTWSESRDLLSQLERLYSHADEHKTTASGLAAFLEKAAPYLDVRAGAPRIKLLLRNLDRLSDFLQHRADEIVAAYRYASDQRLAEGLPAALDKARQKFLDFVAQGERTVTEAATARRLAQSFLTAYRRQYLAWHARCHHGAQFEGYEQIKASPAFRALEALAETGIEVRHSAARVAEAVEAELAKRCPETDLERVLLETPICPRCGLRSAEGPERVPPAELAAMVEQGLAEYARALRAPQRQELLLKYADSLAEPGDVRARLRRLVALPETPSGRELLLLLSEGAATHIRRALAERPVPRRSLAELHQRLAGRMLTRRELEELLDEWVEGEDGPDPDEVVRIE